MKRKTGIVSVLLMLLLSGCQTGPVFKSFSFSGHNNGEDLFESVVKSTLELNCVHCHNHQVISGGLNLQDRDLVFRGDSKGRFIVPGNPEQSRIWNAIILPQKHPKVMPAGEWELSDDDLRFFLKWIKQGAPWPTGIKGELSLLEDVKIPEHQ